jgi:triacylglycerol lipase
MSICDRGNRTSCDRWLVVTLLLVMLATTPQTIATASGKNNDASPGAQARDQVVVLHGLGRSARGMWLLARRIENAGFEVHNLDYPSTKEPIPELVERLAEHVDTCCSSPERSVHFVTHSLGGVLVRAYFQKKRPSNLGRVVMLSPPNQGSELVDPFSSHPLFRWMTGPVAHVLGTGSESLPRRLGPADFELGIITGNRSINPMASWMITGEDDGTVSVESARLAGMADFLVVPKTHTFIMNSSEVAGEVVHFINNGEFSSKASRSMSSSAALDKTTAQTFASDNTPHQRVTP